MAITMHGTIEDGKVMDFKGKKADGFPTEFMRNNSVYYVLDTDEIYIYNNKNLNPITNNYWWEV